MKKNKVLVFGLILVFTFSFGAMANDLFDQIKAELRPDFTVEIDGVKQELKNASGERVVPILYNGTTYLPLRAIGELMGKTVYWYENEKKIEFKTEETPTTVTDADVIVNKETKVPEKQTVIEKTVDKSAFIGEERAKEIALNKAGLTEAEARFERVELDRDNGVWHYEVEFKKGFTEYEADIKADTGEIIKWKVDTDD